MRTLLNITPCLVLLNLLTACHRLQPVDSQPEPQPEPSQYLKQVIEARYTPKDSLTTIYMYNPKGQLLEEKYLGLADIRRTYSLYCLYNQTNRAGLVDNLSLYRFYSTNTSQQLVSSQKYFPISTTYWGVAESDTLIYRRNQLVQQEHWDFYFLVDWSPSAFPFPLWITKRSYGYDSRNRVISETDSVYMTHDYPAGSVAISQTAAKYIFTNRTRYEYSPQNDQEISRRVSISGAAENPFLRYSNGRSIYTAFGPANSTYNASWPGRFLAGTTTYQYEYQRDGKLSKKTVHFENDQTKQVYTSASTYVYQQ